MNNLTITRRALAALGFCAAVAVAARGAHPAALLDEYAADPAYVAEYARAARTAEGFRAWLEREVLNRPALAAE